MTGMTFPHGSFADRYLRLYLPLLFFRLLDIQFFGGAHHIGFFQPV
jgi:hypothetical protein